MNCDWLADALQATLKVSALRMLAWEVGHETGNSLAGSHLAC